MDSSQPQASLSFDIICEVMKVLATNMDTQALRSLSTSCQTLVEPSQRILFRKISFNSLRMYKAMNELLIKSPHLAKYIRNLRCRLGDDSDLPTPFVASVVKEMTGVNRLHLFTYKHITWSRLEMNLQAALMTILQNPCLQIFRIQGSVSIPKSLLELTSPTLTLLDMGQAFFETTTLGAPHHGHLSSLRHLHMRWNTKDAKFQLKSVLELAPLLSSLEVQGLWPSILSEFLILTTYINRFLTVDLDASFVGLSNTIIENSSTISNLRKMTVIVVLHSKQISQDQDILVGFIPELTELSTHPKFAITTLNFQFQSSSTYEQLSLARHVQKIDQNISWEHLPALRDVRLRLTLWAFHHESRNIAQQRFQTELQGSFQKILEQKGVVIQCVVELMDHI